MQNKYEILKNVFNYDSFRHGQGEIIDSIVEKSENNLVIIPTGGGKSLIFQIAGLMLKEKNKGINIVISPLIALMQDQVKEINQRGLYGVSINSFLKPDEKVQIMTDLKNNKVDFLFISPEKLSFPEFRNFLKSLNINMFTIDEAHCCSLWGHNFRVDYSKLGEYLEKINDKVPLLALTATANSDTIKDLQKIIFKNKPNNVVVGGYYRENFDIKSVENDSDVELLNIIKNNLVNKKNGIIYFSTVKELKNFAESYCSKLIKEGKIGIYHGQGAKDDRTDIQKKFINNEISILLATTAFGMGINKNNIDFIIHNGYPGSLESYYQEIGRGGRDGREVEATIFAKNIDTQKFFIQISNLTGTIFVDIVKHIYQNIDSYKENIDFGKISNIFYGSDMYKNSIYSHLVKFGYIEKNGNENILNVNKQNTTDKKLNDIKTSLNGIYRSKIENLSKMHQYFSITSKNTINTLKKYYSGDDYLKYINSGIYINILDFFGDKNGIETLIKHKKKNNINDIIEGLSYENAFHLNSTLLEIGDQKIAKLLDKKLNNQESGNISNIFDGLFDDDFEENDTKEDKKEKLNKAMNFF